MKRHARTCGAIYVITSLAAAHAAASIEGTWKIINPQSSFTPTDGPIPFTAAGQKDYDGNKAALAKGDDSFDITQSRCSSPGVPRLALTPDRFRIWVGPRTVMFQYEWNRLTRGVDLTGQHDKLPPTAFDGQMIGLSEGHWEGSTLVIQADNFSDRSLIDRLVPHSDDMQIGERWHLTAPDRLEDEITITDPDDFTRPWHSKVIYQRQPDEAFAEDVCLDRLAAGQMPLPDQR